MTRRLFLLALGVLGFARPAPAQRVSDLKAVPDSQVVRRAEYCDAIYRLAFLDGGTQQVAEINLRIKTDASAFGPDGRGPVLLPAGMIGDRFQLIFAKPEDISPFLRRC